MDRVDGLGNLVTREDSTAIEYQQRVDMLMRRAGEAFGRPATLLEAINYLGGRHNEYRPASIRKYYAALALAVDEALATGAILPKQEAVYRDALKDRPRPRARSAESRTSAKSGRASLRQRLELSADICGHAESPTTSCSSA